MRILLVAEGISPEPVVGAFRIQKLARAFAAAGHDVTVVVVLAGGVVSSDIPGVHLEVVPAEPSPRERLLGVRDRFRARRSQHQAVAASSNGSPTPAHASQERTRGWFNSLVAGALNLPDDRQGVIGSLVRGVNNVKSRGPFDLLYSSAPAFSVHLAARRVARELDIPWFIEFRDPWRTNGGDRAAQLHPFIDWCDRYLERSCLDHAAAVVAVSESAGATFRERLQGRIPVLVGLNGIDEVCGDRVSVAPRERLRIVYAGSLYPPRDPRPLLESVARCVRQSATPVPEFIFVGHCNAYDGEPLDGFANRLGIGEHFRMVPWLVQREAREMVSSADLLLLPAQEWVEQIPNKLFDYLGARIPVLALADPRSETARLLTAAGGHFVAESTQPDEVDTVVRGALAAATSRRAVGDPAVLDELTVRRQFSHLVSEVERVASKRGNEAAK